MSKSSSRNPMGLVDRYLRAVRFWLPKKAKQEDLLAELGEDLRSQIEAKEEDPDTLWTRPKCQRS